jgi:5,10-methenyltetrahydrofolate synthetase
MLGDVAGRRIAAFWPIRGEVNLHGWMAGASDRGAQVCLPVVVEKNHPVKFHRWTPGSAMAKGIWDIPVPAHRTRLVPDVVIVPLLGVDEDGYRLGNGGGFYDRTLARLGGEVLIIGVGQAFARMKTIFRCPGTLPCTGLFWATERFSTILHPDGAARQVMPGEVFLGDQAKSTNLLKGISRNRVPVAAKMAPASAAAAGGTGGSPIP